MKTNLSEKEIEEIKKDVSKKELSGWVKHSLRLHITAVGYLNDLENGIISDEEFWAFCEEYTNKLKSSWTLEQRFF